VAVAFGKYQLLKKLARGGMGQVFLARAEGAKGFEKLLVIKLILPHLIEDETFLNMFFDEARLVARLNHPNIAQIFELGEVDGLAYIAMEYVPSEDLRRLDRTAQKAGKPLPLGLLCRIFADAAAGLDHAHKARDSNGQPLHVVHRDVSPQNVLVGFDGGVKLIDFGVARAMGRMQHTVSGTLKGKYPYMSPEQIDGEEIDHRSDVFALGIVFWELLTRQRLFKGDDDMKTMKLVRECNVPLPTAINGELPKTVDPVLMKALAKSPKDRYADAQGLRMAIEDLAVQERLQASSSHLAAFMAELYPERISQIEATMDELTPGTELWDAPSLKGTPSTQGRGIATAAGKSTTFGSALPPVVAVSGRSKAPLIALAAVGVAVLGGGLGVRALASHDPVTPVPTPQPPPVQPPPVEVNHDVLVRLRSNPPGAQVFESEVQIGMTPVDLKLPMSPVHYLSFKLAGYVSAVRTLDLSRLAETSTQLDVDLQALPKVPDPVPTKRPTNTGVKTFE
jgi:serine/threonine-protein kinase